MLKKEVVIDKIEVLESGHIQVRQATKVLEDGKEIGKTYHRHVLAPGDNFDKETEKVKAVAAVIHTPEVIAAYKAKVKKRP
jgi:hypothetical protein